MAMGASALVPLPYQGEITERRGNMIDDGKREMMVKHLNLVVEANKVTNLTRIDTVEEGLILHIEDSLIGLGEMEDAPSGRYADLGTGGGFPGITLAIATGRETVLIDSIAKKAHVLDDIVRTLGIDEKVTTYAGRIEELALERPGAFSVVTARALAALPSLIELASPLLADEGILICYKSMQYQEELDHAQSIEDKVGMKIVSVRETALSNGTPRSIIVFKKVHDALVKLPRRPGMAQKRPYA